MKYESKQAELKALQKEREDREGEARAKWCEFCVFVATKVDDVKVCGEITKKASEYAQLLRRSEWANEKITVLLTLHRP